MYFTALLTTSLATQLYGRRGRRVRGGSRCSARLGTLGVEAALLVAADALVRPQSFQNEFRRPRPASGASLGFAPSALTCSSNPWMPLQRGKLLGGAGASPALSTRRPARTTASTGCRLRRSRCCVKHLADGGANQFARDVVGALQLAFVFQFQLAGDGRQRRRKHRRCAARTCVLRDCAPRAARRC